MAELRAPDPTLGALEAGSLVYVGLADRAHTSRDCRGADGVGFPISAHYARWFAVPCRECFPDAPLPGRVPDGGGYGTPVAFLGWQVP